MLYNLYIKSNSGDAPPDFYEDSTYAGSKEEASNIFYKRMPYEGKEQFTPRALLRHIEREPDPDWSPEQQLEATIL